MERKQIIIDIDKDPRFDLENGTLPTAVIEEIRRLNEEGEVFFITNFVDESSIENSAMICKKRFEFLMKNFPFIPPKRFIFTKARTLLKESLGYGNYQSDGKPVLLLDVDEVVWFSGFLGLINEFLGTEYKIDDFEDYYIDEVAIPKERFQEFKNFQSTRSLFEKAEIIPGAIEVIRRLSTVFDIYLYSDCIDPLDPENSARIFEDKILRLNAVLPFIPQERYIFTGVKKILDGSIQIDDRFPNLDPDIEIKILFPSYHNKKITDEELEEKNVKKVGENWNTAWYDIETFLMNYVEKPKTPQL